VQSREPLVKFIFGRFGSEVEDRRVFFRYRKKGARYPWIIREKWRTYRTILGLSLNSGIWIKDDRRLETEHVGY